MTSALRPPPWRRAAGVGGLAATAASVVVLAPWLRPGDLLVRDLVAVARPAVSTALLSGADRLPRDVPGEALVALVGRVVPSDVAVRLALLVALACLGAGVGRLLADRGRVAAAVGGVAVVWNPYVLGRLQQGQWLVVVALAAVPWVVVHARDDERARLARSLALAGLAGVLAPVVTLPTLVVVGAATRRWWALATGATTTVVMALPWALVASAVVPDPDGFVAFAPRAHLPAGLVATVLGGGGYFNAAIASPWRSGAVSGSVAVLVVLVAIVGAAHLVGTSTGPDRRALSAVALLGAVLVVVVSLAGTGAGQRVLADLAAAVPVLSVVRDSHRLLAPWVVLSSAGLGAATAVGVGWAGDRAAALVVVLLVVLALPDPVIGPRLPAAGDLPDAWHRAAALVDADPAPVLVVPDGQTQRYAFTDGRPVAVPLRRLVAARVLVDTRLVVTTPTGDLVVEDVAPDALQAAARRLAPRWPDVPAEDLGAAGIGWVVVTEPTRFGPGPAGTEQRVGAPSIQVHRVVGVDPSTPAGPPPAVLVVDAAVATVWLGLLVLPVLRRRTVADV